MSYSFTPLKVKPALSLFMRIWLSFLGFCVGLIVIFYLVTFFRVFFIGYATENLRKEAELMQEQINKSEARYQELTRRVQLASSIEKQNTFLNQKVHNIFDFIIKSDSIRLEGLKAGRYDLELRGVTPTKEMFTLLVQTPLRGIFDESKTSFYPLKNGWYRFVNTSKRYPVEDR